MSKLAVSEFSSASMLPLQAVWREDTNDLSSGVKCGVSRVCAACISVVSAEAVEDSSLSVDDWSNWIDLLRSRMLLPQQIGGVDATFEY